MNAELSVISPMAAYVGSFFEAALPAWGLILMATVIHWFCMVVTPIMVMAYMDRKLGADIQIRIGPNRVSPFGVFQSAADTIKLFFKEDSGPEVQENVLYCWGAVAAIVSVFLAIGTIPMAEAWALSNPDSGIVVVLAGLCFSRLCIFWAAYSAKSQWSVLSSFRVLAMIAAYIVPIAVALIPPVLVAGSPNLGNIVSAQGGYPWKWVMFNNPATLLSCACMFLGLQIWQGRAPFDHSHATGEIAGGYMAEYSSLRLGLLTFLEYASLLLGCAFIVSVYMGGWQSPVNLESMGRAANIVGLLIVWTKISLLVFASIWIRWSLPSLRIDQIVNLSWRILVPMGLFSSAVTAVWLVVWGTGGSA